MCNHIRWRAAHSFVVSVFLSMYYSKIICNQVISPFVLLQVCLSIFLPGAAFVNMLVIGTTRNRFNLCHQISIFCVLLSSACVQKMNLRVLFHPPVISAVSVNWKLHEELLNVNCNVKTDKNDVTSWTIHGKIKGKWQRSSFGLCETNPETKVVQ